MHAYVYRSMRGYLGMKSSPKMSVFVILDRYGQVCKAIKLLLCLFKRILIEDLDVCQVCAGASRPIKMLHTYMQRYMFVEKNLGVCQVDQGHTGAPRPIKMLYIYVALHVC